MVRKLTGGYKIQYHANGVDKDPIEIDFTPPFRLICIKGCFDGFCFFSVHYVHVPFLGPFAGMFWW